MWLPSRDPAPRRIQRPGLAARGRDMTLCIAAISQKDRTIVTASDFMVSWESRTIDTKTVKCEPIAANWVLAFAGSISVHAEVCADICPEGRRLPDPLTLAEMLAKVEAAFAKSLRRLIERTVLAPLGFTRDDFMQNGLAYLGAKEFGDLLAKVRQVQLDTWFLVAGVDRSVARIFTISDLGVQHHDRVGYAAIGTGSELAEAALVRTYDAQLPVDELIYRTCEAKFLGGAASGVGKRTYILTLDPANKSRSITNDEHIVDIRAAWESRRHMPVPPEALDAIKKNVREVNWRHRDES
jgi:hypothetical protein